MQVYSAISKVQKALAQQGIGKNQTNQGQKFKFRGIDDVYDTLGPILADNGLCILPRITHREESQKPTNNGGNQTQVIVFAEFDLVSSEDGSSHTTSTYGEALDSGDKGTNKAMSAAFKYLMFEAFCIPTEGTGKDADEQSPEVTNHYDNEKFKKVFPEAAKKIRNGKLTVDDCIAKCESVAPLTEEQRSKLENLRFEESTQKGDAE